MKASVPKTVGEFKSSITPVTATDVQGLKFSALYFLIAKKDNDKQTLPFLLERDLHSASQAQQTMHTNTGLTVQS